ncbi:phage tail tape measure protein [bacterium]|nr:MAG: phage tail tape measure protein [bacterium]
MSDSYVADDDTRHDDLEFNPQIEPQKATAWLNLLEESEKAFEEWNDHCDKIDQHYANITRLANMSRDREFQMLWANAEVIKPAIYAKPPMPVVAPKFKDRRPVPQAAAELLERACTVAFDLGYVHDLMLLIRDDLALSGRGVAWARYESARGKGYYDYEKVCFDHKDRRDFLHSLNRCWYEVWWVAGASWLTREEARERFKEFSGDEYQDAEYEVDRDTKEIGGTDNRERAKFWEIWDRKNRRCVWVAKGCEDILDDSDPEIEYANFFPCPQPAFGTLQRGSLVPVPDALQYEDQLKELNLLTGRIHALSEALEAKGFYPAGGAELADAIEAALKANTPGRLLVPISNWAAFGGSKEVIIWLPIDQIAATVSQLVTLRRQIIEDIYQIMGMSDIMRGATDPGETLGAQQLKTQYGGTRVRDKQQQLVRFSRDLVQVAADVICSKFDPVTVVEMTQTDLPTSKMIQRQISSVQQQLVQQQQAIEQAKQQPQVQQMMQTQPDQAGQFQQQAQKLMEEGQNTVRALMAHPTFDQVWLFLQNMRARSFVLDIETDSTILVDENAEKQRRAEFVGVLGQLLPQLTQMIGAEPATAAFCGELLKFAAAPFRAGRSLDGAIDELVQDMQAKAGQPRGDDPTTAQNKTAKEIEQMKIAYQTQRDKQQTELEVAKLKQKDKHDTLRLRLEARAQQIDAGDGKIDDREKIQQAGLKMMETREKSRATQMKASSDMQVAQQKMRLAQQQSNLKLQTMREQAAQRAQDMQRKQVERQQMQDFKQQQMATQAAQRAAQPQGVPLT